MRRFSCGEEKRRERSLICWFLSADVVAVGGKELAHFVEVFALDDYLAVFGRATYATASLSFL